MTLLDFFMVFFRKRKIIIVLTVLFGCGAIVYSLCVPVIYRAESRILPPAQGGGGTAAAMLGGLGALVGMPGGATTGDLLAGVLQGTTVIDKIIDRFNLMELYENQYRNRMREVVVSKILQTDVAKMTSGIVTVAVLDADPERAAEMANAFVEELQNVMQSLAIGEAAQRRLFFEQQMLAARKTLDNTEDELQRYQEQSGLVVMEPQVEALLASIAALRAQVAAKEVEISALRTYARGNNPNLKRAESELSALRGELSKLEQQGTNISSEKGSMTSLRDASQLGLEYQRRLRDVKYATTMYELMVKQFEAAKIDESREAMTVQIIDRATPSDYKFKPKRTLIVLITTSFGLCLGMMWAIFADYLKSLKQDPEQNRALAEIKAAFAFRNKKGF
jgi:capsule polysaccharide export protein KpsE/RkpR